MLVEVGFRIVDRQPVGSPGVVELSNLQAILAAAPSRSKAQRLRG